MKRLTVNCLIVLLFVTTASLVGAYEIPTHKALSEQAAKKSLLNVEVDPTLLLNLGLQATSLDDPDQRFPNSQNQDIPRTITQLFQDGSAFEDDNPRALVPCLINTLADQAASNS